MRPVKNVFARQVCATQNRRDCSRSTERRTDDKFDIHYLDESGNEIPPDQAPAKAGHAKKPKAMPEAVPTPKS